MRVLVAETDPRLATDWLLTRDLTEQVARALIGSSPREREVLSARPIEDAALHNLRQPLQASGLDPVAEL